MSSEWDDDEIVVDDTPREDGLASDEEARTAPPEAVPSAELQAIAAALPQILQRLDALTEQTPAVDPTAEDRVSEAFNDLTARMDVLLERLIGLEDRIAAQTAAATTNEAAASLPTAELAAATEAAFAEPLSPQAAEGTAADGERVFEQLIFGAQLCGDTNLDRDRERLIRGVVAGEEAAICLAARLMLVQSVGVDELPPLLKETGEAYYRWQPKRADQDEALEAALVNTLEQRIAVVGLRNSIESIRPGDRYDATRHVSPDRGVEVAEVRGWVVLRDNGKPLTKASVGLR